MFKPGSRIEKSTVQNNLQFIATGATTVSGLQTRVDATAEYTSWCHARSSGIDEDRFFRITGESKIRVMRFVPPYDESFTFKITLGVGEFTYEIPATTWINGTVEWGDGTRNTGLSGALAAFTHTYDNDNQDYYVTVWNSCVNFSIPFGSTAERTKLTEIVSWGSPAPGSTNVFQIHAQTFKDCTNLTFGSLLNTTAPDLVADISEAFSGCTSLTTEDLSLWDFSTVTNASQLFYGCTNFTGAGITAWDTSNVTDFGGMFQNCTSLNVNFSAWDTSAATTMANMFNNCTLFEGDGLDSWMIPLVADLTGFAIVTSFTNANYDLLLVAWAAQSPSLQNNVTFDMNATTQYLEIAARAVLTGTHFWNISDSGVAFLADSQFTVNTTLGDGTLTVVTAIANWNGQIYWGDGVYELVSVSGASLSHTYAAPGVKVIEFDGTISNFTYNGTSATAAKQKLVSFDDFTNVTFSNGTSVFLSCSNLTTVDNVTLSTSTASMTNAASMFRNCNILNCSLAGLDFSNCTTFDNMFLSSPLFNGDVSNWTTRVAGVSCTAMFRQASAFVGTGINSWINGKILAADQMFQQTNAFNTSIDALDFSACTTCNSMFRLNNAYNQDMIGLDFSSCTNFNLMFNSASQFNGDVSNWTLNTLSAFTMQNMFNGNIPFQGDGCDTWDISQCTDLSGFAALTSFTTANYDALLLAWSALSVQSGVTFDMNNTTQYNEGAARFILTGTYSWTITDGGAFTSPSTFTVQTTAPSESLSLAVATYTDVDIDWGDGSQTLAYTSGAAPSHTYASANTYTVRLFGSANAADNYAYNSGTGANKLITVTQFGDVCRFAANAFAGCTALTTISSTDAPVIASTSLQQFFYNCSVLASGDFSLWDVSAITTFQSMFENCALFNNSGIGAWNFTAATTMQNCFKACTTFNQSLASVTWPSGAWSASGLFYGCTSLVDASWLDLSNASTAVTCFFGCTSLNFNINALDYSNISNTSQMYYSCTALAPATIALGTLTNCTQTVSMFQACTALNPSSISFSVPSATIIGYMFYGCTALTTPTLSITLPSVSFNATYMFDSCTLLQGDDFDTLDVTNCTNLINFATSTSFTPTNYDALLLAWAALSVQASVTFNMNSTTSYIDNTSHTTLTGTHTWTITDGGYNVQNFGSTIFGLRKIKQSYAGSLVRIRRSSDSTEQNIGFVSNGDFDSASFSSFVGGGTGYVTTWYDQSGNGRNVTQSTTSKQPILTLNAMGSNNRPTITFATAAAGCLSSTTLTFYTGGYSVSTIVGKRGSGGNEQTVDCGDDPTTNRRFIQLQATLVAFGRDGSGGTVTKTGLSAVDHYAVFVQNGASSFARADGVQGTTSTISTTANNCLTRFTIGSRYTNASAAESWDGEISELVIFDNNTYLSNYTDMETQMSNYFGI